MSAAYDPELFRFLTLSLRLARILLYMLHLLPAIRPSRFIKLVSFPQALPAVWGDIIMSSTENQTLFFLSSSSPPSFLCSPPPHTHTLTPFKKVHWLMNGVLPLCDLCGLLGVKYQASKSISALSAWQAIVSVDSSKLIDLWRKYR